MALVKVGTDDVILYMSKLESDKLIPNVVGDMIRDIVQFEPKLHGLPILARNACVLCSVMQKYWEEAKSQKKTLKQLIGEPGKAQVIANMFKTIYSNINAIQAEIPNQEKELPHSGKYMTS